MIRSSTILDTTERSVGLAHRGPRRWFYVGMAIAAMVTVVLAFHRSFYLRPATLPPLPPYVIAHGIIFSAWTVLFLAQTALVAAHRTAVHRRLGAASIALAALIIASGPAIAINAARHGRGSLPGLLVMLVDILAFAIFMAAALHYRRRSEIHKRFMVLALVSLLPPAVIRLPPAVDRPAVIMGILLLFVAAAPVYDLLSRRRLDPVSLWVGLAYWLSIPVRLVVSNTEAWHRIATWLIR